MEKKNQNDLNSKIPGIRDVDQVYHIRNIRLNVDRSEVKIQSKLDTFSSVFSAPQVEMDVELIAAMKRPLSFLMTPYIPTCLLMVEKAAFVLNLMKGCFGGVHQ
ncbi:hypothetical protein PanWU01x14_153110 [Parasponia andersonii]|uniref:Uncharacterized protein n=1 Tax=Parasponia andersonii TaxID=3476 RepID=A0A2P5CH76_PARAD|nr:hypothetical protein PanWU01x14_153110 [Parasponia andersonii]